jgi:RNA polymerase sigma factor (TIGR02999 family)
MTAAGGPSPGEVTRLIAASRSGDEEAVGQLFPLVYEELRRLARRQLGREYGTPTLNPTDLVHEAFFKLAGGVGHANDRSHFMAIAARAMRQVLVDRARQRGAAKRGANAKMVTLSNVDGGLGALDPTEMLALDAALESLDPRQRQIVEYRFFAGLEEVEIATLLDLSVRTVQREWVKARAWLYRELYGGERP